MRVNPAHLFAYSPQDGSRTAFPLFWLNNTTIKQKSWFDVFRFIYSIRKLPSLTKCQFIKHCLPSNRSFSAPLKKHLICTTLPSAQISSSDPDKNRYGVLKIGSSWYHNEKSWFPVARRARQFLHTALEISRVCTTTNIYTNFNQVCINSIIKICFSNNIGCFFHVSWAVYLFHVAGWWSLKKNIIVVLTLVTKNDFIFYSIQWLLKCVLTV